jgi:uncharacterized protein YdbL (DUF1318 family)
MPRALTFTSELGAQIIGARRVGATLRDACKAAGVPWETFKGWLKAGRSGDARLEAFARDIDKAAAQFDQVLRARVLKGTEEDARLAFDIIKWNELRAERAAKLRALEAQAIVDEKRAEGTLVDRHEHTMKDPVDELRSRIARLAGPGEAGSSPGGDQPR